MATIKVKFRPSILSDRAGTIYYQIIHDRKPRQVVTDYHVYPSEWDERRCMVRCDSRRERRSLILSIRERIRGDLERLNRIIRKMEDSGVSFSTEDVTSEFERYADEYSVFNYMQDIIVKLKQNGKLRTSETYVASLNSFKKFREGNDIMLDCLTSDIMESYEAWLRNKGIAPNTISFYIRILRAVYNRAVDAEIIENRNPFRRVYTGMEKTIKRALPFPIIKKIKNMDLSLCPPLDFARDIFILSFMLRGMSFIDMAFLKKSDLKNGYIIYRRRKTGQQLTIEWTKEMQQILDKYPENRTVYLLPIIKNPDINEHYAYRNVGYSVNHNLKVIAKRLNLPLPLTLYVARHSWATAAKSKGIPLSIISEGMGHDSETTTQIYLASLDSTLVDRANSKILKSL